MDKKTIGSFIAALRKANGMTQKDLAAIPAIAEIFGVTCDELLRGERKSPTERAEAIEENETSPKGEKQRQRLLKTTLSQYQNRTYIAMGVTVAGLIAALIGNLAFHRVTLGFLLGAIFFAASIVCQAVFVNKALLSVEDAGIDAIALSGYKRKVVGLAERSIGLTVLFVGFTFPLIMVDAYFGLGADSLLIWGSMGAAAFLLVYAIVLYFLNASLLKKWVYGLTEEETVVYYHNRKLKKRCTIGLVLTLAVTVLFHAFGSEMIWSTYHISSAYGQAFHDYESFVEYMEQDVPYDANSRYYSGWFSTAEEHPAAPEDGIGYEGIEYYDEEGNVISEEEALTETVEDINGNVVCTYIGRNKSVTSIRYSPKDGTVLPIQVITTGDYQASARISEMITMAYCLLYPIELLAALFIYLRKRMK